MLAKVPVPICICPVAPIVPPEVANGNTILAQAEAETGSMLNVVGVGLTFTVKLAVVAQGVAPVVCEAIKV